MSVRAHPILSQAPQMSAQMLLWQISWISARTLCFLAVIRIYSFSADTWQPGRTEAQNNIRFQKLQRACKVVETGTGRQD